MRIPAIRTPGQPSRQLRAMCAQPINSRVVHVARLRHVPERNDDHQCGQWNINKEDPMQEACSISHPPRTGPRAVFAVKPDHVPIALPRDFSSNEALMIARLPGTKNAAARPWKLRQITNIRMLEESPQTPEAAPNPKTPTRNIARRPNESPNAPPTRIRADKNKP
jgi:hypothetical protein